MHLFFGTSTSSPWAAENVFFVSIWLSFLGVDLSVANTTDRDAAHISKIVFHSYSALFGDLEDKWFA